MESRFIVCVLLIHSHLPPPRDLACPLRKYIQTLRLWFGEYVLLHVFLVILIYLFCPVFEHHHCCLPGQPPPKAHYSQSLSPSKKSLLTCESLLPTVCQTTSWICRRHLRLPISQPKPMLLLSTLHLESWPNVRSFCESFPDNLDSHLSPPLPRVPPTLCKHPYGGSNHSIAIQFTHLPLAYEFLEAYLFVFLPPVASPALGIWQAPNGSLLIE